MANEKRTSVKILASTKKTNHAPLLYGIGGFLIGVLFSSTAGFIYLSIDQKTEMLQANQVAVAKETEPLNEIETSTRAPEAIFEAAKVNAKENEQVLSHTEHPIEFPQPQDDELSRAFAHPAQMKPMSTPRVTSSQNQPVKMKTEALVAPKIPTTKIDKTNEKTPMQERHVNPVDESPVGSVQTTITTRTVDAKKETNTPP